MHRIDILSGGVAKSPRALRFVTQTTAEPPATIADAADPGESALGSHELRRSHATPPPAASGHPNDRPSSRESRRSAHATVSLVLNLHVSLRRLYTEKTRKRRLFASGDISCRSWVSGRDEP
ncbi:MAG: hypothetical protein D6725_09040 [Planctomycetota bacterium]|nr:MAG: hypothetical protein D6725_09040 [Planctomycetota bacterium]